MFFSYILCVAMCILAMETAAAPIGRPAARNSAWDVAMDKYQPETATTASSLVDASSLFRSSSDPQQAPGPNAAQSTGTPAQSAPSTFTPNDGTGARDPAALMASAATSTSSGSAGSNPALATCYASYQSAMTTAATWTDAQVQEWLNGQEPIKYPDLKSCVLLLRSTPQQQQSQQQQPTSTAGGLLNPLQQASQIQPQNTTQQQQQSQQQQQQQQQQNAAAISQCNAQWSTALTRASTWSQAQLQQWLQSTEAAQYPALKSCILLVYASKTGGDSSASTAGLSTVDSGAATPTRASCAQYQPQYNQLKFMSQDQISAWFLGVQAKQNAALAACMRYMITLDEKF